MTHQHHSHPHRPTPDNYNRAFAIGVGLNIFFVLVEAGFGFFYGSLALVADAGHNLSDVLSLLLAWGAAVIAARRPTARRTYGFRRMTIYASVLSALLLLVALGAITWEAIGRFAHPVPQSGLTIIVVAGIGVVINTATALLFVKGQHEDLNIRGAYLHMAADAGVSLGVVLAGVAILWTGWNWLDPTITLAIVAIIFVGTWGLLKDSLGLAFDVVPRNIDPEEVASYLVTLPGVRDFHDLHIWALSTTQVALTVHLVMETLPPEQGFLADLAADLKERFGIGHSTVQVEDGDEPTPCRLDLPECHGGV